MTCSKCQYWQTIATTNSAQGDRQMETLNYRNCIKDESEIGFARFVNGDAVKCDEFKSNTLARPART